MSIKEFSDDCQGCKPAIIDIQTGRILPDTHPVMVAINKVWAELDLATKQAFHRVTCLNSRDERDLAAVKETARRFAAATNPPTHGNQNAAATV